MLGSASNLMTSAPCVLNAETPKKQDQAQEAQKDSSKGKTPERKAQPPQTS